ncbi:MAG: c-type cytochrome [Acidiferrobacterales bacterium]
MFSLSGEVPLSFAADDEVLVFRHTVSGEVLDVSLPDGEQVTEAVTEFHHRGENAYVGNAEAVADGEQLYVRNCLFCHGPGGVGKIGPSLVDEQLLYPNNKLDNGLFEAIYGGTVNLMAGWKGRLSQDDILKVIAYVRSLQSK